MKKYLITLTLPLAAISCGIGVPDSPLDGSIEIEVMQEIVGPTPGNLIQTCFGDNPDITQRMNCNTLVEDATPKSSSSEEPPPPSSSSAEPPPPPPPSSSSRPLSSSAQVVAPSSSSRVSTPSSSSASPSSSSRAISSSSRAPSSSSRAPSSSSRAPSSSSRASSTVSFDNASSYIKLEGSVSISCSSQIGLSCYADPSESVDIGCLQIPAWANSTNGQYIQCGSNGSGETKPCSVPSGKNVYCKKQ